MPGPCPAPDRLAAALRNLQPASNEAALAAHVTDCPACQAQLEALAGGSGWLEARVKTHAARRATPELLEKAILALEAESGSIGLRVGSSSPPKLDFLQPTEQPGALGKFGPYDVMAHVASGGMGIVLKARDPRLDRVVALKILPPALLANPLARARFVREARAAAAVVHEHVVPIYAVDECGGLPYIVMQFVQGQPLSDRIRATGSLRLEEILRIGSQTAAGLAAAHAQGLIHRDVKPGNVLLENSVERVKLTDFGLARAVDDASLTRAGELAGTPEFMAPEQAGGLAVDHRTDLFSLGSVLYAMATGSSPFPGDTLFAVIRKVCETQPTPVHEINSAMPRWLSGIIARLMAKAPTERFQTAQEVGELLERYLARVQRGELGELPGNARPSSPTFRVRKRAAFGAAAVLGLAAVLFFTLTDRQAPLPNPPPPVPLDEPFVVRNESGAKLGAFTTFERALMAAPADAIVELCWTGPHELQPVQLPDRPLVLRAGARFQPAWISRDSSASAISARAALTLDGIRFVLDARETETPGASRGGARGTFQLQSPAIPPSGVAVVSITNGGLHVKRCTLDVCRTAPNNLACVILENVAECRIENSLLFARPNKGVVWQRRSAHASDATPESSRKATSLILTNCAVFAGEAIWLDLEASASARVAVERCTFRGLTGFYFPPSFAASSLAVETRRSLFDSRRVIYDARRGSGPTLPQLIRWQAHDDLFSPTGRYVLHPPPVADHGPASLSEWNQFWSQTGNTPRQVLVEFAGGWGDANPRVIPTAADASDFVVRDLRVVAGPALPQSEWSRFGADAADVGPVSRP